MGHDAQRAREGSVLYRSRENVELMRGMTLTVANL
jgi:hypothetical protein